MSTVSTKAFTIRRLTREESGDAAPIAAMAAVQQNYTVKVTYLDSGRDGNTKVVNGQTWYECTGSWSFDNPSITIPYGQTAKIKFKMDNASTNGWKLVTFIPKSSNPSGGPVSTSADANGEIDVTDNNTVAGTYAYGIYIEQPSNNNYASYDPVIVQDGGGEGSR